MFVVNSLFYPFFISLILCLDIGAVIFEFEFLDTMQSVCRYFHPFSICEGDLKLCLDRRARTPYEVFGHCVNNCKLIGYSDEVFIKIKMEIGINRICILPISAFNRLATIRFYSTPTVFFRWNIVGRLIRLTCVACAMIPVMSTSSTWQYYILSFLVAYCNIKIALNDGVVEKNHSMTCNLRKWARFSRKTGKFENVSQQIIQRYCHQCYTFMKKTCNP